MSSSFLTGVSQVNLKRIALFLVAIFLYGCINHEEKKFPLGKGLFHHLKDSLLKADSIEIAKKEVPAAPIFDINDSTEILKKEKLTYLQAYDKSLTLWQTPFKEIYIETNFGKAHVLVCGSDNAEPLVLLHGLDASSTMWYPNIQSLSAKYKIYAIDFFLEPGKSVCEARIKHTNQIVDWYYEIFDKLNLKQFNLLGASRGGWLAINIALRNKARINKLVLLSPAQTFTWIKLNPKVLGDIVYTFSPKRKRLRTLLETLTVNVDKISQVYINQYYLATKKASKHACFLQMTPFSEKELRSLKMPVLLLVGDHDIINGDKSLKKARLLISNIESDKIKNSGHFLSMDQPEIIDKKIIDFLK